MTREHLEAVKAAEAELAAADAAVETAALAAEEAEAARDKAAEDAARERREVCIRRRMLTDADVCERREEDKITIQTKLERDIC